jgi:hypothetical protein
MPLAADDKAEFKMLVVVNRQNSWGRAAERFVDAMRSIIKRKAS